MHRVRWERGELHAPDHPDITAESALAVLGGDPPVCLQVIDMWRRQARSPELITLGRRPGEQHLGLEADDAWIGSGAGPSLRLPAKAVATLAARTQRRDDLRRLLSLPAPMIDRLVLTVLASCSERWGEEEFRAHHGLRLGAALSVRATPALRRFGERLACGTPDVGVSPARAEAGGPMILARVEPHGSLVVSAELPVEWLSNVWGRGVSEPGDEFVLAIIGGSDDGREFDALVARWETASATTFEATAVPARIVTDAHGARHVVR
jgi:hypothetical protein